MEPGSRRENEEEDGWACLSRRKAHQLKHNGEGGEYYHLLGIYHVPENVVLSHLILCTIWVA